jgi:hypothetical protein
MVRPASKSRGEIFYSNQPINLESSLSLLLSGRASIKYSGGPQRSVNFFYEEIKIYKLLMILSEYINIILNEKEI